MNKQVTVNSELCLQDWFLGKSNVLWLQPDALYKAFAMVDKDEAGLQKVTSLPGGIDGAIFIWDGAFFSQSNIGENRQLFLWQALEAFAQELGERLLVIQAPMQMTVTALMMQSMTVHTHRSVLTEPLFQMVQSLQQLPFYPAQVKWVKSEHWIDYPKALPAGFFKFWKTAEKQLFPSADASPSTSQKQRPHK